MAGETGMNKTADEWAKVMPGAVVRVQGSHVLAMAIEDIRRQDMEIVQMRDALRRADKWILQHCADGQYRDGACKECFPSETMPHAWKGFRCVVHEAKARAALTSATGAAQ